MWSPVPLSLLPLSCPSVLPSPRWLPLVCFLYLCLFLFRYIHLFYFLIPQVSSNRVFVFFCVFFISHTTNPPGPSMLLQMARFHSFYGWVVFHCTFTPIFFIYSFLDGHLKWKWMSPSHVRLFTTPWTIQSMDSRGQNTGVGSLSLLQGIFPTQGSNPGLPHCRWVLYQLNHKGNPGILEWVAYPFSSGTSWPRNQIRVSCIPGGFFTYWSTREAPMNT